MKRLTLILLFAISISLSAQMNRFPLLEPIDNTIPESFIIEGDTNELIMFWIDSTDLHISKSLDDGANWNTPTTLVDNENILDSLSDLNALKLNSGRILVTYKFKFHYSIYSDDNGTTWSDPLLLVTDIGTIRPRRVMESSLSQTEDNKIWFVYNRLNIIYIIQSDDGTAWTEKDTLVIIQNGTPHFSSVNSHWDGSLLLTYQLTNGDTAFLYQSQSVTNGMLWNEPKILFDLQINEERPRIFRDSSKNLWLTFTESEETPFEEYSQTNIFYSKLLSGSEDWSVPAKFTIYTGFDGWQNISVANSKTYISFISNRTGGLSSWYGIADENIDITPPAVYDTQFRYTNNYPNADVNINSKVFSFNSIKKVMFHYTWESSTDSIELFDDGLHNDINANDYIYGNDFLNLNYNFVFDYFISATDQFDNRVITTTEEFSSPILADGGDAFLFDNNNIVLPINSKGALADIMPNYDIKSGGRFDENLFLFSGGFALSGYTNGTLWANGVMTASRIDDYLHGNIDSVDALDEIFVVRSSQPDFYQSWTNWKDAVKQGADFYDGDGDGIYNPVDLNNNGAWDANEDKPDLLGDITAFTVFNDGLESSLRNFSNVEPQGIEIKQTVFSYNKTSSPKLENVIFVRYKIENMGTVADILDSVYFSLWADFDIGDFYDDVTGTDTLLNTSYTYNRSEDDVFGVNPPACFISLIQGPPVYISGKTFSDVNGNGIYEEGIDTPLDSANNRKGELLGIEEYPGAKNNKLTANINYMKSHPTYGTPNNNVDLRNYMLGYKPDGELIDPCNWEFGNVFDIDCNSINPRYLYSGDPVTQNGWLSNYDGDQRQLGSTGPFNLVKGEPIKIIAAYIVGRGTDHLNSITEARRITNDVMGFYNTNFSYVPVGVRENTTSQLPTEFELSQNYPNPFNPSTTIKYSIPTNVRRLTDESSIVSLKVYDILGREVATLVNKQQKPGNYEVKFDASNLSSGVYFYRLQSGLFNESRKMLLLK